MGTFGSGIKSVQRGIVTLSTNPQNVTITAVNTTKSFILSSWSSGTGANIVGTPPRVRLADSTTITIDQIGTDAALVAWQVVEHY